MKEARRALVVRIGRLGDTILATPIIQVLQQSCGVNVRIDFAVSPGACTALLRLDRRINRVIPVSRRKLPWYLNPAKVSLRRESARKPYDLVFNLECGNECDDFVKFVHHRKFFGRPLTEPRHRAGRHCVDTEKTIYARVLGPGPTSEAVPSLKLPAEAKDRTGGCAAQSVIVNPGFSGVQKHGYRSHKRWPDRHWLELIGLITQSGRQVAVNGRAEEKRLFEPLLKKPGVRSLFGVAIADLVGAISRACCVISVDTGTMHLATALGTPTIALFGPSDPGLSGPYPGIAPSRVLVSGVDCQPCVRTPLQKQCGFNRCMQELKPEAVFEAFEHMMQDISVMSDR